MNLRMLFDKVDKLERRVAELEAARTEQFSGLIESNAARMAAAHRLRDAIRKVLQRYPHLEIRQIGPHLPLADLGLTEPPAIRTLQEHVQAIRAEIRAARQNGSARTNAVTGPSA
jgi:hypothetical protein